jgi:hypothetical protein
MKRESTSHLRAEADQKFPLLCQDTVRIRGLVLVRVFTKMFQKDSRSSFTSTRLHNQFTLADHFYGNRYGQSFSNIPFYEKLKSEVQNITCHKGKGGSSGIAFIL